MNSGDMQGWEIAKERVADFKRERDQTQLAATHAAPRQATPARRIVLTLAHAVFTAVGFVLHVLTIGRYQW